MAGPTRQHPKHQWVTLSEILLIGSAILTVIALGILVVSRYTWLPGAELNHAAVVAKNVAEGKGLVTSSISNYISSPDIPAPETTLPPGWPLTLGLFFLLFGTGTFTACLPSVLFFGGLGYLVYHIGKRRFGTSVGLAAAFLTLSDIGMTQEALSGRAGTAASLFFMASIHFIDQCFDESPKWRTPLLAGVCSAAALYFNFNSFILIPALVAIFIINSASGWLIPDTGKKLARIGLALLTFSILTAPLFIRNAVKTGAILGPALESRWAFSMLDRSQLDESGFILPFRPLFNVKGLPDFQAVRKERGLRWLLGARPKTQLKKFFSFATRFQLFSVGLTLFGALGLFWTWAGGGGRWAAWSAVVFGFSFSWIATGELDPADFKIFTPLAALFAAYAMVELFKWICSNNSARLALTYVFILIALFGLTSIMFWKPALSAVPKSDFQMKMESLADWLKRNARQDEAVLTRMPHHLAWMTGRRTAPVPLTDWDGLTGLAKDLNAKFIVIDQGPQVWGAVANASEADFPPKEWGELFKGAETFRDALKVYSDGEVFFVYRLPGGKAR